MNPLRALVFLAGLFGAAGVGLSAMAAHAGGGNLGTAASMLLFHAPALLALGLSARGQALPLAGLVLALGVATFCGDLAMRDFLGHRLFPMAAPAGGLLMIAGWLGMAVGGLAAGGYSSRSGD